MFDWELRDPWFLLLAALAPLVYCSGHPIVVAAGLFLADPAGAYEAVVAAAVVATSRGPAGAGARHAGHIPGAAAYTAA